MGKLCFAVRVGGACLALLLCLPGWADQTIVPMTSSAWELKVFPEPGSSVSEAQAGTFSFASDEEFGPCLGIGPWRAGQWGIRCESRRRFANAVCTVRGYYRTEAPVTFQATVGVLFYRQKQKLNGRLRPHTWQPISTISPSSSLALVHPAGYQLRQTPSQPRALPIQWRALTRADGGIEPSPESLRRKITESLFGARKTV